MLELAKRNRFSLDALNNLFDSVRSVLLLPTLDKVLGVVWVVTQRTNIELRLDDVLVEVVIDLHHVEYGAFKHVKTSFFDELVVFESHGAGKFHQRQRRDV